MRVITSIDEADIGSGSLALTVLSLFCTLIGVTIATAGPSTAARGWWSALQSVPSAQS
jgi:hypothetical protein